MKKLFLFLFLTYSISFGQDGEWKYVDGWVYTLKTNSIPTIEKKNTNTNTNDYTKNKEILRSVATNPYKTTDSQVLYVGEIFGEKIYFDPRIRPTRCLQNAMESGNYSKTPEPNGGSLLMIGFIFLLFIRNLNRNKIKLIKP